MRYSFLVQLHQMCQTLADAAAYLLVNGPTEAAPSLLKDCKLMAGALENAFAGCREDFKTERPVKLLSDTALLLQQCDNAVKDQTFFFEMVKQLQRKIKELDIALQSDTYAVIRVVFLAELGGKWDSLESVYRAFCRRKDCDVSVVLVPVFRAANDGGKVKQEVVYQDYLTPMGIPFIEYTKYDFEKDCPELVFTCNPYESTFPKEYWPERLAKLTRLVYIPYFIIHAVDEGVTSTESTCQMPIHRCAWRIIGQDEKLKAFFRAYAPTHGENMLVAGSPKLDHVVELHRHGLSEKERIPKWEQVLKGKKVFLWNTFYSPELSSLSYCNKLIQYFSTHEEMALIWRPHPMTMPVAKLYFSSKDFTNFTNMIEALRKSKNIILDENASYRPAFYYSDAMLSDYSSLMEQYLPMDKPILWLKNPNEAPVVAEIIGTQWMERARNFIEVEAFLKRIGIGEDRKKQERKQTMKTDMKYADGCCGERVSHLLIREMKKEDGMCIGEHA